MIKKDQAIHYFKNQFNCSQSVFTAFAPDFGISPDESLKIACAFGGGMGRQQLTCGAVTGALMALGLKYGKGLHDDENRKKKTYDKCVEFMNEFIKENGSVNCRELLDGLDMKNPDDHKVITEQAMFETRCRKYVADAVEIAEKLME
jgi:C_GCAxxG_C_C family probable redox protein